MTQTHFIARGRIPVSGFEREDGGHVDRVAKQYDDKDVTLLVAGAANTPGYGLGYVDSDLWRNMGEHRPRAFGADLYAYGHAGVISADGRNTGWYLEQAEKAGNLIRAEIGDVFVIEDPTAPLGATFWTLRFAGFGRMVDYHNVKFEPVEVRTEPSPPTLVEGDTVVIEERSYTLASVGTQRAELRRTK